MTPRFAIGIGCRRACPASAIASIITEACGGLPSGDSALFTLEAKRDEPGLHEAAQVLGLRLTFLSADQLRPMLAAALTHSPRVEAAVGISSVAEAAALAGAGPGARLLVPRRAAAGATCAVATADTGRPG